MCRILAPHVHARQTPQFRINERNQVIERRLVAFAPIDKELRYFLWNGSHGEDTLCVFK